MNDMSGSGLGVIETDVAIVGAGSSAVDLAALLHENGAAVRVVCRRPGLRFHAVTANPARARLAAIAAPIVPRPRKPIRWSGIRSSLLRSPRTSCTDDAAEDARMPLMAPAPGAAGQRNAHRRERRRRLARPAGLEPTTFRSAT